MAPLPQDVVLILGGGGALGAFSCGIWEVLGPRLAQSGARLAAVSGSSIGAINAAFIAQSQDADDWGAATLAERWTQEIATPSFPFLGPNWNAVQRSWNGVLTGMLLGNRALHRAQHLHWNPWAGLNRFVHPLADRSRMGPWLSSHVPPYRSSPGRPLLGVPAVDVVGGNLRVFDSDQSPIVVDHLLASSAIPVLYEPVAIDDRLYWDGDMTRESPSAPFLRRVVQSGRLPDPARSLLITVDQMPRQAATRPTSGLEVAYRMLDLLLHGKVRDGTQQRPAGMGALHIVRRSLPDDNVSGQFDYSPQRIELLRDQGRRMAEEAWHAWLQADPAGELLVGGDSEGTEPGSSPLQLLATPAEPLPATGS